MKLLSIAIPCYNSEAYMRHCIESLLPGGDEVEILIVDDGSTKDRTAEIADEYERMLTTSSLAPTPERMPMPSFQSNPYPLVIILAH